MGNVIVASPNEAKIISGFRGTRTIIGSMGIQMWCCERSARLSLELMTMDIQSTQAETTKGVRVNVSSVAQIKVKALRPPLEGADPSRNRPKYDMASIHLAAQHFLGDKENNIRNAIQRTMEGHQRQILGTLTVEEIYKDRAAFSERVREHVEADLGNMGFELVSYTVTSIDDLNGYMQSLGATQTALVKREAEEGKARNENEAKKKVALYKAEADIAAAQAEREAHVSVNEQKEQEAQADRDLQMKKAAFAKEVNKAEAEADAAGRIERAIQDQDVVKAETEQAAIQMQVQVDIAQREAERMQKQKEGASMAELMQERNYAEMVKVKAEANATAIKVKADADAAIIKVKAEAEAEKIRAIGEAKASAVQAEGEAEALVLHKKAEAFKQYGEAALVQMIVEKLPELANAVAAPLSKTDKMVFVSQDAASGSMLTGDVNRIIASLPETVQGLTGLDMRKMMKPGSRQAEL